MGELNYDRAIELVTRGAGNLPGKDADIKAINSQMVGDLTRVGTDPENPVLAFKTAESAKLFLEAYEGKVELDPSENTFFVSLENELSPRQETVLRNNYGIEFVPLGDTGKIAVDKEGKLIKDPVVLDRLKANFPSGELLQAVRISDGQLVEQAALAQHVRANLDMIVHNIGGYDAIPGDDDFNKQMRAESNAALAIASAAGLPNELLLKAKISPVENGDITFRGGYGAFSGDLPEGNETATVGGVMYFNGGKQYEDRLKGTLSEVLKVDPSKIRPFTAEERANRGIPEDSAALAIEGIDAVPLAADLGALKSRLETNKQEQHGALDQIRQQMASFSAGAGVDITENGAALAGGKIKGAGASLAT